MAIIVEEQPKQKRVTQHEESTLQGTCFRWFISNYPQYRGAYFGIFNELSGQLPPMIVARLKQRGLVKGVSDSILLVPNKTHHGCMIEFKTLVGRQSPDQVSWQRLVESLGYRYEIIRSLDDFQTLIKDYLSL